MTQPSIDSKYRAPNWIQYIVLVVGVGIIAAKGLLPGNVWGPSAVIGIAAVSGLVIIYNKAKTGRCLPNDKR
jgi:hypothetical protein